MLLPHLAQREDVALAHVVTNTSLSAANAQRRFDFAEASTDVDRLLGDDTLDAIFVVTRHHTHADLVCRSLEAGKATFVEKPLALDDEQLARILDVVAHDRQRPAHGRLQPAVRPAADLAAHPVRLEHPRRGRAVPRQRRHARRHQLVPQRPSSRVPGSPARAATSSTPSRWWLDARPREVLAVTAADPDDVHVVVRYDDGSVASIDYVTHGNPRYPKETLEVSAGGRTARLDNFGKATVWTGRRHSTRRALGSVDKGQAEQVARFVDAVRSGRPMPISLDSLAATTAATLAVGRSLASGGPITL